MTTGTCTSQSPVAKILKNENEETISCQDQRSTISCTPPSLSPSPTTSPSSLLPEPSSSRKRKRQSDAFGRMNGSTTLLTGVTKCPLCGTYSQKQYALGRGIAAHLHAIHTPWKPTALSRKIARREWERQRRQQKQQEHQQQEQQQAGDIEQQPQLMEYVPTPTQVDEWEAQVAKLIQQVERQAHKNDDNSTIPQTKSGKPLLSYKESLSPFLQAASDGNLAVMEQMVRDYGGDDNFWSQQVDRHGSTAAHWAAGGGHLECLKWLLEHTHKEPVTKRRRRRDGKTCLHYAARNGQLECVQYLVETQQMDIQESTGEGTTPLHMACYGGHLSVVQYLVSKCPSTALAMNEWGCTAAHWVAMTLNQDADQVAALCWYLQKDCGVDFGARQHQGHSALHKAAQRKNRHVLEWMADNLSIQSLQMAAAPDEGGHTPSDIWCQVGGDTKVADWMKSKGW